MIVMRLSGGLGNQLFQYALGLVLQARTGRALRVDTGWFASAAGRVYRLNRLKHPPEEIKPARLNAWLAGKPHLFDRFSAPVLPRIPEPDVGFVPHILELKGPVYLDGYWQTPRYWAGHEALIRKAIRFHEGPAPAFGVFKEAITALPSATALHVRRGDYAGKPKTAAVHGTLPLAYYRAALERLGISAPQDVFLFTDDPEWVAGQDIFRGMPVVSTRGLSEMDELQLMAACKKHIIANSSFSWWGAWLSQSAEVVAPLKWFADASYERSERIPENWIRI